MDKIIEWLNEITGIPILIIRNIVYSLIVILIFWIIKFLIDFWGIRRLKDVKKIYLSRKISSYTFTILILITIGIIWIRSFSLLVAYFGLLSAGVAIALRDIIANVAGWLFIIWRRPFELGDRIEIKNRAGDVVDIRLFQFSLMEIGNWVDADQSTGRVLHIPNHYIFTEFLANYTKGFNYLWNEIPVTVTFESNWKKAKQILLKIAKKHSEGRSKEAEKRIIEAARKFMIFYKKLTPIVYVKVVDNGIKLTIRYLCEPRGRRGSENEIWTEIIEEFTLHNDIDFAYPTQRFYDNLKEGKSGTKPKKRKTRSKK